MEDFYSQYIKHYWHVYALVLGQILSYPFYVLSVHVLYYPFSKNSSSLGKKSHHMMKAMNHILKTQGMRGLYRGFVPTTLFLVICYWNEIRFLMSKPKSVRESKNFFGL